MSSHVYINDLDSPPGIQVSGLSFFVITATLLAELKKRLAIEKKMATTDGLTGLLNARAFKECSGTLLELATRYGHHAVLGYIDLDNFKGVNDQLGHSVGDAGLEVSG